MQNKGVVSFKFCVICRAYTRPPELVTMVMSAVCVLLGKQPDWASAKQVLSDANFINLLINYDKASAPEKVCTRASNLLCSYHLNILNKNML